MTPRFVPPHPPRRPNPVASWRGLFGERARTAVYGWSQLAFETDHLKRRILGFTVHVLLKPEWVQHVLLDNAANYAKPGIVKQLLDPIIGRGLLTSDGELWREQRRIVAASFSPAAVEAQRATFVEAARTAMARWSDGEQRDMAAEATRTTMTVIAMALFGGDPRLTSEDSMRHITAAIEGFSEARLLALLRLPQFPLTPKGRAGKRGQVHLRRTLGEVVADRWDGRVTGDFLSGMIDALRERFPADEARALAIDNAATFYLAGHETTANALTWTLFLLAAQPELQEEMAAEATGGIGRWQRRCGAHRSTAAASPDASGIASALSARAALRPASDRAGQTSAMWLSSQATSSRSGRGCCIAMPAYGTIPTRSKSTASPPRMAAIASNICRSGQAAGPASAPHSPRPRR